MGKTKIDWATDTINCITGCLNGCDYCYARKMACRQAGRNGYPGLGHSFDPTFHPDKIDDIYNLPKAHKRVFLDSMGDWFSDGVIVGWFDPIIKAVKHRPDHTFLVLTKRPDQMMAMRDFDLPSNIWFGVSVTCQEDIWRIDELVHNSPIPHDQHVFVSIEPLHGFIDCDFTGIDWVIIGAESGNRKCKIAPKPEWINHIERMAEPIPIFMKDNLRPYLDNTMNFIQEFPMEMRA